MSEKIKKFNKGIRVKGSTAAVTIDGEIRNDSANKRIKVYHDTDGVDAAGEQEVVTADQTQTLTNKTVTSPVINTGVSGTAIDTDINLAADSNTILATQKATKAYVDAQINTIDDASEITFTPAVLADWDASSDPGNVDGGLDQLAERVTDNDALISTNTTNNTGSATVHSDISAQDITDIGNLSGTNTGDEVAASATVSGTVELATITEVDTGTDTVRAITPAGLAGSALQTKVDGIETAATADQIASEVVSTPSGNLAAANVQAALDELQTDIDTRALDSALTAHKSANGDHTASNITNVAAGNLAATTVQAAVDELQTDIDTRALDSALTAHKTASGDHTAAVITNVAAGNLAAVTVQAALDELQTDIDGRATDVITTRGDTVIGNSSGVESRLAIGTSGQVLKSDGTDVVWGTGGGSGGINYITDGSIDAEADIGSWGTYNDAADVNPVDGTGAAVTQITTYTRTASTILRGSYNFKFTTTVADNQGQGASVAFTIDDADKAKKLTISFDYDASDANYADDDIRLSVYDVTNSNLIRINGEDLKGGKGTHYAQFQTASDSTSYRLIIHQSSTNATGYSVYFDNFSVGPKDISRGSIVTDWESYTPTISNFGTVTINYSKWRRVGDTLEVDMKLATGTVVGSELQIGLPSGLSIGADYSATIVGTAHRDATTEIHYSVLATAGDTYFNIGNRGTNIHTPNTGTQVASGETFALFAHVKIQGWSSDTAMSSDLGGREIVVEASGNGTGAITADSEDIDWTTVVKDTTGSWGSGGNSGTGGNDQFTTPETGYYDFDININISAAQPVMYLAINGTNSLRKQATASHSRHGINFNAVYLTKGDLVTFRINGSSTLVNDANYHHIRIAKRASPQTVLETETVAARYDSSSGASVANNANMLFENLIKDTHNSYDTLTGVYTIPVSGWYSITAVVELGSANDLVLALVVNGTGVHQAKKPTVDTGSTLLSDSYYLNKDDTVTFKNVSGSSRTMSATNQDNTFSIARIK